MQYLSIVIREEINKLLSLLLLLLTYLEVKDMELFGKKLMYTMPQTPIKNFDVDVNDEYNPDVPPLFNRMFKYNEHRF